MGRPYNILLRRRHDVPVRRRGDVPLRHLGDVPPRHRWVFHLSRTCNVTETYRETTSLRRCYNDPTNVLLPVGMFLCHSIK